MGDAAVPAVRVTYGDVFRVAEYRALWSAQLLSVAGDQLARVALTVLVYDRTRSALLAAVTFVMSVIPVFLGGVFLSGLADRLPRRAVMIGCDVIRLLLVLVMTLPKIPLAGLVVLLFAVTMFNAPFSAARAAIYPEILAGERYSVGTAVTLTTIQLAQVFGFAVGGVVVGVFGIPDRAVHRRRYVRGLGPGRPARRRGPPARLRCRIRPAGRRRRPFSPACAWSSGTRTLRTPMLFGWLAALYNAPEGIATPFAHALGGGATRRSGCCSRLPGLRLHPRRPGLRAAGRPGAPSAS